MDKTIRIVGAVLAAVILAAVILFIIPTLNPLNVSSPNGSADTSGIVTVYFFYGEECPHCHEIMPFIETLREKYPEVRFQILEIYHNRTNYVLSVSLNKELRTPGVSVPEVIVADTVLYGSRDIPAKLEAAILDQKKKS